MSRGYGSGHGRVAAVDDVTVDFDPGTLTAVMGPSGSGKSTLMHLLAGLDRPSSGGVTLGDQDLNALSDDDLTRLRRDAMGFVFQAFTVFDDLSVAENVDVPFRLARDVAPADPQWRAHLIDALDLAPLLARRPTEISGGQQQRVAIARALVHRPSVVFADEPTGNLDLATGRSVLALLAGLAPTQGCTVVMVTHDPAAAAVADRVLVLADGRLVHDLPRTDAATLSQLMLAEVAR